MLRDVHKPKERFAKKVMKRLKKQLGGEKQSRPGRTDAA
jgi:hypothetical protein